MRHATQGAGFRVRAIATVALLTVGLFAALRGLLALL